MAGLAQQQAARSLPRLARPLAERVQIAAAWYSDRVRMTDIAAAAVLSHSQVTTAAVALGHPLRGARGEWLALPEILALASHTSDESTRAAFGLSAASMLGIRALLLDSRPRAPRPVPPPEPRMLPKRCPACKRVEHTDQPRSPCCGVAY